MSGWVAKGETRLIDYRGLTELSVFDLHHHMALCLAFTTVGVAGAISMFICTSSHWPLHSQTHASHYITYGRSVAVGSGRVVSGRDSQPGGMSTRFVQFIIGRVQVHSVYIIFW